MGKKYLPSVVRRLESVIHQITLCPGRNTGHHTVNYQKVVFVKRWLYNRKSDQIFQFSFQYKVSSENQFERVVAAVKGSSRD